jgi:prepilin-type N-terminal cleavage/methylation domain-containing protein
MEHDLLKGQSMLNKKGVTLIELLVVLVISGIVIGGVYRVFISQTKAYTVQDQVAEIQQDVRGAMEIMVRDIRMAGFQERNFGSALISDNPIVIGAQSITVNYEYVPTLTTQSVTYDLQGTDLRRTVAGSPSETLLTNVTTLDFRYGIDANEDKVIDGINGATGVIPDSAFVQAAGVGTAKVFAVRITLTANPSSLDPDVTKVVSPRTLTSVVTPRNMYLKRFQAYWSKGSKEKRRGTEYGFKNEKWCIRKKSKNRHSGESRSPELFEFTGFPFSREWR